MSTKLLTGLDLLVIEDESLLRKQIAAHLESLGADVTGAGNLQAAGQALGEFAIRFRAARCESAGRARDVVAAEKKFSPTPASS